MKNLFSIMSTIKTPTIVSNYISKDVAKYAGGKWLIHGTKHRKDTQLQSLVENSCIIS